MAEVPWPWVHVERAAALVSAVVIVVAAAAKYNQCCTHTQQHANRSSKAILLKALTVTLSAHIKACVWCRRSRGMGAEERALKLQAERITASAALDKLFGMSMSVCCVCCCQLSLLGARMLA